MEPPPEYQLLGKQVAFSEIDHELTKLWGAGESQARASLMNLVIFSACQGSLLKNQEVIEELMRIHACRAIVIELNADAPDNSSFAWIKAHCRLMGGTKTVCNEQLSFWLNGHMRGRIPNSVFAHLDSDLPLFFWWQGELTSVFRPRLYKRMNRFIFDSSKWADPKNSYKRIIDAYVDTYRQMIPHDLEWARTYNLRLGIAKLFDEPAALQVLGDVEMIRIRYNPDNLVAIMLLLTWITRQTGLTNGKVSGEKWHFQTPDGRTVSIVMEESNEDYLISECSFHIGEHNLSLIREGDSPVYNWKIDLPNVSMEKLVPADSTDPTALVAGQIERGGQNSIFISLLDDFVKLWSELVPEF